MTPSTLLSAFEILADLFPDGVLIVEREGTIRAANGQFARIVGTDVSGVVGRQLEEFVPARHRGDHAARRTEFFESGASRPMGVGLDLYAQRADGVDVPIDVSLGSIELDGSHVVIAAVRDLTAQREAERTRSTLEIVRGSTRSAVLVIEASGLIAGVNRAATRLLGVDAEELVSHPIGATVLGATPEVVDAFADCCDGTHIEEIRVELVTAWGALVPVDLTARPVTTGGGNVSAVSLLLFDRSEQEASQLALRQFQARLEVTERLGGLGSWELDGVSGELQMSPGLHELLGISPLEADGTIADLISRMAPDLALEVQIGLRRCTADGTALAAEGRLASLDGRDRWVVIEGGRAPSDRTDDRPRVVGIVQDVTARHEVMDSLLEADRLKDEFLSTVSHELRTPLTVIVGFADHLRRHADGLIATYLDAMHRNAAEMELMVDQLLDISRVQSGRVAFDPEPMPLRAAVDDVLVYLATAVREHRVENRTSGITVLIDPMGFRRMLSNLVSNAAKFSPAGSTIEISETVGDGEVVVTVRDEGIGIAAEDLETIFDLFVQARHGRPVDVPGTGVGLTIVKRYVEMHGGRVWVESEPGVGTCFHLSIPTAAPPSHEDGAS